MSTDFNVFLSVVGAAVRAGTMERPVELWAIGASGGLWGAFFNDDGTAERVTCSSPVMFPIQLFLFDQIGSVSKYTLTASECGEKAYEHSC